MENAIKEKFGLPVETVIIVGATKRLIPTRFTEFMGRYGHSMTGTEKIPAIKELRSIVPGLGLGAAKHAVEGFAPIADYVKKNKKWPEVQSNGEFDLTK